VKRGRRAALVGVAVAADGLGGGERLDLDAALPQGREHRGVGPQLPVRATAENQPLGQLSPHVLEVLQRQRVALAPPQSGTTRPGSTITSRVCSSPSTVIRPKL
jgi:hypothetical protein